MIAMTNSNWRQQWQTTTHPISRRLDTRVCFDRILNFYYIKLISYRHLGAGAVIAGDYHVTQTKEDITVSHRYMDRLLGLDTSAKTVTVAVEPGMKVSTLSSILATINLSVDLAGRVPDLTITDCLAVGGPGLGCGGAGLGASVISVQVNTCLLLAAVFML